MTDQTEQDTEAAVDPVAAAVECLRNLVAVIKPVPVEQVREAFGGIIPIIERDKLLIGLYVPAIAEVLAALDSAQGRAERLDTENHQLFKDWSIEKSRRELFSDALDEVRADRDLLTARVAELETEQGRADARLRVEHYRLQTRNSEARALADGWRTYTLQQRGEDGEWITMREAFGAILAALDGDAAESSDETGATR